jgi:hypothetical protein
MAISERAVQRLCGLALVAAFALLGGCALDTDRRPEGRTDDALVAQDGAEPAPAAANDSSTCTDGVVQQCVIRLPTHDGVKTCFRGLKLCEGGQWSVCGDADDIEQRLEGED